ncbi:hypothetical protein Nepgr_007691 [Nepenthes gracilis]|uniref:Uncharacterized protein n=1 Tax=Nepenthes gracilis TaxID=150966 RepID=A0AAD3XIR6_NEPGR|nr:hypothetical protein Nepgr_007691 [Nepenthes gracilis]
MEENQQEEKPASGKKSLPKLDADQLQKDSYLSADSVSSPLPMRKSSSTRSSCLCSPTTHVGSFRCRLHRDGVNISRGRSVGSDLSELAAKYTSNNKSTFG